MPEHARNISMQHEKMSGAQGAMGTHRRCQSTEPHSVIDAFGCQVADAFFLLNPLNIRSKPHDKANSETINNLNA